MEMDNINTRFEAVDALPMHFIIIPAVVVFGLILWGILANRPRRFEAEEASTRPAQVPVEAISDGVASAAADWIAPI